MKERFEKQLQSDFPFMQQNRDKKERNVNGQAAVFAQKWRYHAYF